MVSNILLVESKNDKCFIQALVEYLNLQNIDIYQPICLIDDYECLSTLNLKALMQALETLRLRLPKRDIKKIGIVLDHDGKKEERISLINNAVSEVFDTPEQLLDVGKFISISIRVDEQYQTLQIACYLTNVNERGELETLLKEIKTQDSTYADCLEKWRKCLEDHGKTISDKEFDKFWISNYIRFDTCQGREKQQAGRKCSMNVLSIS